MANIEVSRAAALHVLPPLPYAANALDPVISARTIGFHYGKHRKGYVDTLNKLIAGTEFEGLSLEKVIVVTAGKADKTASTTRRKPGITPSTGAVCERMLEVSPRKR